MPAFLEWAYRPRDTWAHQRRAEQIRRYGKCASTWPRPGADPWFDLDGKGLQGGVVRQAARAACAGCPVMNLCAAEALEIEPQTAVGPYGVRGGLSAEQRRWILKHAGADIAHRPHALRTWLYRARQLPSHPPRQRLTAALHAEGE